MKKENEARKVKATERLSIQEFSSCRFLCLHFLSSSSLYFFLSLYFSPFPCLCPVSQLPHIGRICSSSPTISCEFGPSTELKNFRYITTATVHPNMPPDIISTKWWR